MKLLNFVYETRAETCVSALVIVFGSTGLCKFPQNIFIEPLRNAFLQYGQRTAFCIVFREHPPLRSTIIEEIGPVAQLEAIVNVSNDLV